MAMIAWSTTAANNVLANTGINMDEGMAPSALNDSIREIMAVLKTAVTTGALTVTGTSTLGVVNTSGAITMTWAQNNPSDIAVSNTTDGTASTAGFSFTSNAGTATLRATAPSYTGITGAADAAVLNLNNLSGGFQVSIAGAAADFKVTAGAVTVSSLAGVGSRNVVVDANGVLSAP